MNNISIIIPYLNYENLIFNNLEKIINKINLLKLKYEIIVINDGSTDNTTNILKSYDIKVLKQSNKGKGAAVQNGIRNSSGDYILIQDADLEYDPKDYKKIIDIFNKNKAQVVYGSRVLGKKRYRSDNFISLTRVFFNHILTILSNAFNNQSLTDAHTCYKAFSSQLFKSINLEENGFAFCPEITTKISNLKIQIFEVSISYNGRNYKQGKKISYKDGIRAIYALLRYKFIKNI